MEHGKETFLARWSRLKRSGASETPVATPLAAATGAAPPEELPPVETLGFSSDFSAFLQPKVRESVKRAALKKLFHSEHFNQMDGLDVYIDDYNQFEPIPEEMLRQMEQARNLLFGGDEKQADAGAPVARSEGGASGEAEEPRVSDARADLAPTDPGIESKG